MAVLKYNSMFMPQDEICMIYSDCSLNYILCIHYTIFTKIFKRVLKIKIVLSLYTIIYNLHT